MAEIGGGDGIGADLLQGGDLLVGTIGAFDFVDGAHAALAEESADTPSADGEWFVHGRC
jgi:hypothetical protein